MRRSAPALFTPPAGAPVALLLALASAGMLGAPGVRAAPAPIPASAQAPVALLPSVGTAKEDARRDLDSTLRQALLDEEGIDLLSPVETREHVMSLAEMGLVCLPEDLACMVKLGIVAKVDFVLVPVGTAAGKGKELDVELSVIDVSKGQRVRTVQGHFAPDDAKQAAVFVKKALGAGGAAVAPPHDEHPHPPTAEPAAPLPVGAIVTGVSGAVAGLALVGAVSCDLIYDDVVKVADAKTRKDLIQPVGAALWVTAVLAAAGVGAGIYLLTSTPEP